MPKTRKGQRGRKDLLLMVPESLKIVEDEKDPRFDPRSRRPIDEAMVQSIMLKGVIQPLVIYPDGDDVYVSVGHQRRINAIEANRRLKKLGKEPLLVPCTWRKDDDVSLFIVRQMENNIRSGDDSIDRARNMQRILDLGGTVKDAATAFGCTEQTVRNTLALLDCDAKVQRAIESGAIKPTVASALAKLPRAEQRERLDKMVKEGVTRGRKATIAAKTGRTDVKVTKMRPRVVIEKWREELASTMKPEDEVARLVVGILDYVTGNAAEIAVEFDEATRVVKALERASRTSEA